MRTGLIYLLVVFLFFILIFVFGYEIYRPKLGFYRSFYLYFNGPPPDQYYIDYLNKNRNELMRLVSKIYEKEPENTGNIGIHELDEVLNSEEGALRALEIINITTINGALACAKIPTSKRSPKKYEAGLALQLSPRSKWVDVNHDYFVRKGLWFSPAPVSNCQYKSMLKYPYLMNVRYAKIMDSANVIPVEMSRRNIDESCVAKILDVNWAIYLCMNEPYGERNE